MTLLTTRWDERCRLPEHWAGSGTMVQFAMRQYWIHCVSAAVSAAITDHICRPWCKNVLWLIGYFVAAVRMAESSELFLEMAHSSPFLLTCLLFFGSLFRSLFLFLEKQHRKNADVMTPESRSCYWPFLAGASLPPSAPPSDGGWPLLVGRVSWYPDWKIIHDGSTLNLKMCYF